MAVNFSDLKQWVQSCSVTASTEIEFRILAGRAYYYAFYKCKESLQITPTKEEDAGAHKKYINALKLHPDKKIQVLGSKMDSLKLTRSLADYECAKSFDRRTMSQAILDANKILIFVDSLIMPKSQSVSSSNE